MFIPKNKRNVVVSEEKKWEEELAKSEREKERAERRKMESRALVAKTVAAVSNAATEEDDMDEESGGATNKPPHDDDTLNPEAERDAWEIRELLRLLTAMDQLKQQERERLEYERRKNMTPEEILQHDIETGRYQAPGSGRDAGTSGKYMQRFYHRGAYYMAEDEWDNDDVRHKAAEYAKSATGEDKIDRSTLPKVMQVKGFGFARQNTRYQGLAKEDTTDKRLDILPLVRKKPH